MATCTDSLSGQCSWEKDWEETMTVDDGVCTILCVSADVMVEFSIMANRGDLSLTKEENRRLQKIMISKIACLRLLCIYKTTFTDMVTSVYLGTE